MALHSKGECRQLLRIKPRMHNRLLLPMIDRLLAQAQLRIHQLDVCVCDVGPGALMGVRLGVAAAQALAYAADLPVLAISSLQALAYQGQRHIPNTLNHCVLLPMLDARFRQIYWACYRWRRHGAGSPKKASSNSGLLEQFHPASLAAPQDLNTTVLPPDTTTLLGLGDGWNYLPDLAATMRQPDLLYQRAYPQAQDLIGWAQNDADVKPVAVDKLEPIYLRRAV